MARGGINKAVVQKAREALLARGENPTIDAVRVAMGNTGSKTTIHRYLKELEDTDQRRLAPREHLTQELGELVGRLAERLKEEGDEYVQQAQARFDLQKAVLQADLDTAVKAQAALQQQFEIQAEALASESEHLSVCRTSLQTEHTRNARLTQECSDLQIRLNEKDEHIRSLEEKHQHARDALEHYRQAVKEQREQDQRRHEAQVQQAQVEVRQLQQGLIVKQDELMRLSRDNERMLVEARQARKDQAGAAQALADKVAETTGLTTQLAQALGVRQALERQIEMFRQEQAAQVKAAQQHVLREARLEQQLQQANATLAQWRADRAAASAE
ncbi:DNA-binding protein [Pseudomonas silvicola]|nr:DNA-binding protein [Pseudomonas silvicola]